MVESTLKHMAPGCADLSLRDLVSSLRSTLIKEVMSVIAHDVSQPLSALSIGADAASRWLDRTPPNLDQVRGRLEKIVDEGRRATDIINHTRTAALPDTPPPQPTNILHVLEKSLHAAATEAATAQVSLFSRCTTEKVEILGDAAQLNILFLDLILNALDAIQGMARSGGEVVGHIDRDSHDGLVVRISDNGPGFTPDALEHAFDHFYSSRKDRAGLGLPISRAIAHNNGGYLEAANQAEGGAVITLWLPACPGARQERQKI